MTKTTKTHKNLTVSGSSKRKLYLIFLINDEGSSHKLAQRVENHQFAATDKDSEES